LCFVLVIIVGVGVLAGDREPLVLDAHATSACHSLSVDTDE
jgi:hypothetical protein